ncbi:site-specific integrase [uncultured Methylobacterium sp.]|jgi:integrase|uniref:tyrosine-type recombinase/integrase n=1 Tax=uncultured Methylobacterium sp. TaxID=157278 RepID=UPI002628C34F|nr:site-specific integrase [uncultured Methylobacterium sp.]
MPVEAKGPRLWFKPGNVGADGKRRPGTWTIKDDGGVRVSTGIRATRGGKPPQGAQDALARYILERRQIPRDKHRGADAVEVADVISIYMQDRAIHQARPAEVIQRCTALLAFWGERRLSEVTGRTCREYATFRLGQQLRTANSDDAKKKRVSAGTVRRELEDLRAAINYHRTEGYCREMVAVTLPDPAPPRDRWLTRSEAAALIRSAWRYRETYRAGRDKDGTELPGKPGRFSRRHVARFILVALYTGTRASAVCGASLGPVKGSGWIDLERGVFYRRAAGEKETKKRRPPVRLPVRLLAHMRRWHANGQTYAVEWLGKPVGTGVEKAFRHAAQDAGLTDVTPHTLRHTAATWLMLNGTDLWEAAGYLGMTVETLERVYGHHHPSHQKQAAANIVRKA